MEWKSNAGYKKQPSEGTIFNSPHGVTIHRMIYFDGWWFSCYELNISQMKLNGETFDEAVKEAKEIVKEKLVDLWQKYAVFVGDSSENVMVRYFSK